ncbi:MAG: hypothetical protein NVS3B20_22270 [Polyangiales bacterium]
MATARAFAPSLGADRTSSETLRGIVCAGVLRTPPSADFLATGAAAFGFPAGFASTDPRVRATLLGAPRDGGAFGSLRVAPAPA